MLYYFVFLVYTLVYLSQSQSNLTEYIVFIMLGEKTHEALPVVVSVSAAWV